MSNVEVRMSTDVPFWLLSDLDIIYDVVMMMMMMCGKVEQHINYQ